MATSPNFGWLEPDNTDLVKNGALAIRTLGNAIDASLAELKGGTTGQVLSKTSNTDMDFTWVAQDDSNAIQNAIVDAKGDLIAATAADTPARLAVGTNGQVLTADSTASTGLAWATPSAGGQYAAGKNKVLNGDFSIWQRGTSFTTSAGVTTFTADRWRSVMPSSATLSRQTFTAGTAPVSGYEGQYYFNATITSSAQNYEHGQFIENARTFAGQTVTLSFWARSTVGAQPLNVAMYQNFGTGGSPSSLVSISATSGTTPFTPTSSWIRYVYTFDVPSVSGKTFGTNNDSYLWIRIGQYTTTATNTSLDYWGVQLEAGSTVTAFQTATGNPASELAACQRYYFRMDGAGAADSPKTVVGFSVATTTSRIVIPLPVTLRVKPSSLDYNNMRLDTGATTYTITGMGFNDISPTSVEVSATVTSGPAAGTAVRFIPTSGSTTSYLGFNAEL